LKIVSSTQQVPNVSDIPTHVAIIMDGNGRWATQRHMPRTTGHGRGVQTVRNVVKYFGELGTRYLTLFAFSSENWRRPRDEVNLLMRLFLNALEREVKELKQRGIRLRVIGDTSRFEQKLQDTIAWAEQATADNDAFHLTVAANYGGRWDILQATRRMLLERPELGLNPEEIDEQALAPYLSMAWAPEPDLFIRTGGEQRVSNFLIWQLAYTELYFTEKYWPEFDAASMAQAVHWYQCRERRFGRTSAQVPDQVATHR
jgi:undecaprenyl diphosphate synthase